MSSEVDATIQDFEVLFELEEDLQSERIQRAVEFGDSRHSQKILERDFKKAAEFGLAQRRAESMRMVGVNIFHGILSFGEGGVIPNNPDETRWQRYTRSWEYISRNIKLAQVVMVASEENTVELIDALVSSSR